MILSDLDVHVVLVEFVSSLISLLAITGLRISNLSPSPEICCVELDRGSYLSVLN